MAGCACCASANDLSDYAAEVPPDRGTLLLFLNGPTAWHGFEPFEGRRRVIQVNWVTDESVVRREGSRHRLSAFMKRLFGAGRRRVMPLHIDTFRNGAGGSALYKALSHPLAAERAVELLRELAAAGPVALYDPDGIMAAFDAFYPLKNVTIDGLYVQNVEHLNAQLWRTQGAAGDGAQGEQGQGGVHRQLRCGEGANAPSAI